LRSDQNSKLLIKKIVYLLYCWMLHIYGFGRDGSRGSAAFGKESEKSYLV